NIKVIEKEIGVSLIARGNKIKIIGGEEHVKKTENILSKLIGITSEEKSLNKQEVKYSVKLLKKNPSVDLNDIYDEVLQVNYRGKKIRIKTIGQKLYIESIKRSDIVF